MVSCMYVAIDYTHSKPHLSFYLWQDILADVHYASDVPRGYVGLGMV